MTKRKNCYPPPEFTAARADKYARRKHASRPLTPADHQAALALLEQEAQDHRAELADLLCRNTIGGAVLWDACATDCQRKFGWEVTAEGLKTTVERVFRREA